MRYEPANWARDDERPKDGMSLQQDLREAQQTIRKLEREVRKARERLDELGRAYHLTVANLVRTSGTCALLEHERDLWRRRAERRSTETLFNAGGIVLSPDEVAAIRRAVARLHHPDAGGDQERMKLWNTALDALE